MTLTRHCSYLFNPSRDSVICHSARHRSTFRLSAKAETTVFKKDGSIYFRPFKNCRKAFDSFLWIHPLGQNAVDSFIEAIEIDSSLDTAERLAVASAFPDWTFSKWRTNGFTYCLAIKAGKVETRIGAETWKELSSKL